MTGVKFITFFVLAIVFTSAAVAAELSPEQQMQRCMKKAEDLPDIGMAEAEQWLKQGGGDRARLCRAFAQFYRNEFAKSAEEFAALAAARDKVDRERAASLHAQAGLAYMRADDNKNAETEYGKAVGLEPQNPEVWVDRATERAADERYWDAIDDLNRALKIEPDMPEALRARGQAWAQLGNDSNARHDIEQAVEIEAEDSDASSRATTHPKGK